MTSASSGNEFVSDTMALVKRIEGRSLGPAAATAFDETEAGRATILVPAMVFAEILYLSERGRVKVSLADVSDYLRRYPNCKELPMSLALVESAGPINDIPDLHDRLIAGSARNLNRPLISSDGAIQASAWVSTIW